MLILRGSSVTIVTRLDGVMIGVLLPTEQYFYFGHSFQTGCRIPPPPPPYPGGSGGFFNVAGGGGFFY
jgi:hypothetical protein